MPIVMEEGTVIDYRLRLHGLPVFWRTRITRWEPPHAFQDVQDRGPWALWEHLHTFEALPGGGTLMRDQLRLKAPFGVLGRLAWPVLKVQVRGIFHHREAALRAVFGAAPKLA
jgi:ligand-binding SRPBCC domain-containing protein